MIAPAAPAAAVVTVDTPEFVKLRQEFQIACFEAADRDIDTSEMTAARGALIAHIDALIAQAREEGNTQGWAECEADMKPEYDAMRQRAENAEAEILTLYDRQREDGNTIAALHEQQEQAVAQGLEAQQDALTEVTAQRDALRERLAAPQQHAQCTYPKCQTTGGCNGPCRSVQQHAQAALSDEQLDEHINAVLRPSGTKIANYTMQKSRDDMRAAMRSVIASASQQPAADMSTGRTHSPDMSISGVDSYTTQPAAAPSAPEWTEEDQREQAYFDRHPDDAPPIPPQEAAARDERAVFEAWAKGVFPDHPNLAAQVTKRRSDGEYEAFPTQREWDGWQARAALAAPTAQVAVPEGDDRIKPLKGKPWPEHDDGSQIRWVTPDGVVHGRPSVTDMLEYAENCLKADIADGYNGHDKDIRMGWIPTLRALFDRTAPAPVLPAAGGDAEKVGDPRCHKCHGNSVTHASFCPLFDAAKEQAALAEWKAIQPLANAALEKAKPLDVDTLAQFIRKIDGNHSMGAGTLAGKIAEWLTAQPSPAQGEALSQHADWCPECHARESMAVSEFDQGRAAGLEEAAKAAESVGRPVGASDGITYIPGTSTDAARAIRALNKQEPTA